MDGWPALMAAGGLHDRAEGADVVALARIRTDLYASEGIAVDPLPKGLRCRETGARRNWFNQLRRG